MTQKFGLNTTFEMNLISLKYLLLRVIEIGKKNPETPYITIHSSPNRK